MIIVLLVCVWSIILDYFVSIFFFFFQAEDGIRDSSVTGVQTCALPIYPKPGMSRETSTLIALQNLQADLNAGFTAARDMSSHGNGYGDVDIRNAINEGRIDGPRFRVSGRGIVWAPTPPPPPPNPLTTLLLPSATPAPPP